MRQFLMPFLPLLLLPIEAHAQADSIPVHMTYSAYAAGLNVIDLEADLAEGVRDYRVDISFRTTGAFGLFIHSVSHSTVRGAWQGLHAMPQRFESDGVLRGEDHRTMIDYVEGQPTIRVLEPPAEKERDLVAPADQRNTIDTLSAMAELTKVVADTGRCEGSTKTFDGRRLGEISVHTAGTVKLPPEGRTVFAGDTLQCDFDGRQLGGWEHDADREELARPQHGSAWLARIIPGGPLVPVRMSFHTRFFGQATMYLTGFGPGLLPPAKTTTTSR